MANEDIAVLATKVYELSVLPLEKLEEVKWDALLIVGAVYAAATPEGVAKANADRIARFGPQIEKEGLMSALHPKWQLRTDDGKPPVVKFALESALTNPVKRSLKDRLAALLLIKPEDRPKLRDLALALQIEAWDGALGDARLEFSKIMRGISKTWTKDPWLTIVAETGQPIPVMILIENQGYINDGGLFDMDPSDDPYWATAVREWDIDFLRDNPLAKFYQTAEAVATTAADTAGETAKAANSLILALAKAVQYAPYIGAALTATMVVVATRRPPRVPATG